MGSIVKSIGKAIKKVAKGVKKIVKKIGPALIIAAAVYAGVAFYGASLGTAAAGTATLSPTNFMSGLSAMGKKVTSFFSPTGMAGTTPAVAGAAPAATAGMAGSGWAGATGAAITGPETMAALSTTASSAVAAQAPAMLASSVAGGMTTGQALVYMTKMNMLATGVQMVAGFLDDSEEKQMQHDKDLLAMKYAYGKPMTDEQKAWKAQNPNWIREHPAISTVQTPPMRTTQAATSFAPRTMANLPTETTPPSPYVQQQRIGQPTFGRRSTRQFETPAATALASRGPGLITKAAQGQFNPNQQRRYS